MNKKHYRILTSQYKAKRIFNALLRSYRSYVISAGVDLDDRVINLILDCQSIYLKYGIDKILSELTAASYCGAWPVPVETWDYIIDIDEETDDE